MSIQHSETTGALAKALAAAQREIGIAVKDALNPHFRSKYADLQSVDEACRPALSKYGISIVQAPGYCDGVVSLTTRLMHADSGEWIQSTLHIPPSKHDAQGIVSATTYARRCALAAMAAVPAGVDDDGETAVGRGASLTPPPQPLQPPQPPVSVAVPSSEEANLPLDWDGPIPVVQGIPKPIFKVLGPRPSSPTAIHCEDCYGRISSLDQVMGGASPRVTLVLESGGLFVNLSMFGTWSYPAKKGDWIEVCGITKRGKYLNFKSIRAARAPEGFKEGSDPSDIPF
jgi:hypothetical protein